jgi:hypothetical protein
MKLTLARLLLLLPIAATALEAQGLDCRRRLLTEEEHRTLADFVLKRTGLAVDRQSIRACRDGDVYLDTLYAPQPDGSERFARLDCWPLRKSLPDRWYCAGQPLRGFRADPDPRQLSVWVAIDTPTALPLARRLASLGFELLARDGTIESCAGGSADGRTLASLRAEITGGDGVVLLGREPTAFWLAGGDAVVHFELDSAGGTRAKCWREPDVLVTG